jgi:ribonuclease VapC
VTAVLDASALLAYLHGEPGSDRVTQAIADGACISTANVAEVLSKRVDAGDDPRELAATLTRSGLLGNVAALEVVGLGLDDSVEIAALRPQTRARGLSLGDRACLALAARRASTAVTADAGWTDLELPIEIQLIR